MERKEVKNEKKGKYLEICRNIGIGVLGRWLRDRGFQNFYIPFFNLRRISI